MTTSIAGDGEGSNAEKKEAFVQDLIPVFFTELASQYAVADKKKSIAARAMAEFIWNYDAAEEIPDVARRRIVQNSLTIHCGDILWETLKDGVDAREFPGGQVNPEMVTKTLIREVKETYNQWLDLQGIGGNSPNY